MSTITMTLADMGMLSVEIMMAVLGLILLLFSILAPKEQQQGAGYFTTAALTAILLFTIFGGVREGSLLGGMYFTDEYAFFFKVLFLVTAILTTFASHSFTQKLGYNQAEYYTLLIFSTLGMMILAGAGDLITLYLGLELMSLSFVILVAFKLKDGYSAEAGMKYVILTAMSSAVLLYGLSLLFGVTGTTVITDITLKLTQGALSPVLLASLVLVIAGFGFKIAAVPFHMWAPDIYQGAPTPITAFLAAGSKAAAFAALLRILMIALPVLNQIWIMIFVALAVLTMIIGNLIAIPQRNVKRMMAYSSISQAGYIILGIIAASVQGISAILFYLFIYMIGTMIVFFVINAVEETTGGVEFKNFSGLHHRAPLMAWAMMFALFSMAGIPPVVGFFGKFYLFVAVMEKGFLWLALLAILMSMVSVYYYLQVVKVMFIADAQEDTPITNPLGTQIALALSFLGILVIGIYPTALFNWGLSAAHSFLGIL